MKGIQVTDDFINAVLKGCNLTESQEVEVIEEGEDEHVCPLCESQLEEAISEEQMSEHVGFMLSVLNESLEDDGESLDEDEYQDEDEDEDELDGE